MKKKESTLKKVFNYIGKYKFAAVLSLLFSLISAVLMLFLPVLFGDMIDCIVAPGQVDYAAMTRLIIQGAGIILATAIVQWLQNVINNRITSDIVRDIRVDAIRRIETLPLKFLDNHPHGDLMSRVIADTDTLSEGLLLGFSQLFSGLTTIVGTIVFMLSIDVRITLVVVLVTPLSLFAARFISKRTYSMFRKQSEAKGRQTAYINERLGSQKVIKAFCQEENAIRAFDETNQTLASYALKATFYSSLTNPVTRFVNSVVYAGVTLVGALAVLGTGGVFSVGSFTCFLSYATQYTKPFNDISSVITELQNALACAKRVFELIEEAPEEPDKANAQLSDIRGEVQFRKVCFSYEKDKPLLQNISFSVKAGQRVAIVGPTGCGKTTLINLLMRFYDADSGDISIDGVSIYDIPRKNLREQFGMVLQDTWIKNASIRENIVMGKTDVTDEQIKAAAKSSGAHSFIKRLPKGYDTVLGKDFDGLSEGQKQLLCITRVMLCPPPMLILDEATSSIDTRTELLITEDFSKLMQGRTSFIVAHRLSTIREADLILVMKDGNIIETGTHQSLLAQNGFYKNLYESQFMKV